MSNRILGVLIILGFITIGYLYYNFSYLPNIETEKLRIIQEKKDIEKKILIKKIALVKQDEIIIKKSNADIINEIKDNNNNYKTFKLENNTKAYFKENDLGLGLYYNYEKVGNFDLVYSKYLFVDLVKGNNNDLYIEVGNNKYYFNNKLKELSKIELNIDVLYVKEGINNELIFLTVKGSFVYSIINKTLDYFSYFNDYVYFNNGYIGIIKPSETKRLKNLGLESNNKSIILYYNPYTKEKKILYSTNIEYNKLYIKNSKLYIETINNDLYELENI